MLFSFLSLKGLSALASAHVGATLVGTAVVGAATIVAVDEMSRNPVAYDKFGNAVMMGMGAMFTPVLLLEDGLRKAGMDIHEKGMLYNGDGKSISEIWHESAPEGLPMSEMQHVNEIINSANRAISGYKLSLQQISEVKEQVAALQRKV
jgi:hypothetical protein